jgi:hypothetical protein
LLAQVRRIFEKHGKPLRGGPGPGGKPPGGGGGGGAKPAETREAPKAETKTEGESTAPKKKPFWKLF